MKFLFIVQGEGRGHMTQALALKNMLLKHNHTVVAALIGKSERRIIPDFFLSQINCPVITFESPNFVLDPKNKGLKLVKTFRINFGKSRIFIRNITKIDSHVKQFAPDVIINFYDLLGGLYSHFYKEKRAFKYVCIAHQLLMDHKDFIHPKGHLVEKVLLKINSTFTSAKADLRLALSFTHLHDCPQKKLFVVPPLLRNEVLESDILNNNFLLAYMVNDGYGEDIIEWHKQHPDLKVICFWDRKGMEDAYQPHDNLIFYQLNDTRFLKMMSECSGFVSTAGFESICEAMYFGKPVMMIPANNHYEQLCNSIDAVRAGAGIKGDTFNMSLLVNYFPKHKSIQPEFQRWVDGAEERFIKLLSFSN